MLKKLLIIFLGLIPNVISVTDPVVNNYICTNYDQYKTTNFYGHQNQNQIDFEKLLIFFFS